VAAAPLLPAPQPPDGEHAAEPAAGCTIASAPVSAVHAMALPVRTGRHGGVWLVGGVFVAREVVLSRWGNGTTARRPWETPFDSGSDAAAVVVTAVAATTGEVAAAADVAIAPPTAVVEVPTVLPCPPSAIVDASGADVPEAREGGRSVTSDGDDSSSVGDEDRDGDDDGDRSVTESDLEQHHGLGCPASDSEIDAATEDEGEGTGDEDDDDDDEDEEEEEAAAAAMESGGESSHLVTAPAARKRAGVPTRALFVSPELRGGWEVHTRGVGSRVMAKQGYRGGVLGKRRVDGDAHTSASPLALPDSSMSIAITLGGSAPPELAAPLAAPADSLAGVSSSKEGSGDRGSRQRHSRKTRREDKPFPPTIVDSEGRLRTLDGRFVVVADSGAMPDPVSEGVRMRPHRRGIGAEGLPGGSGVGGGVGGGKPRGGGKRGGRGGRGRGRG